MDGAAVLYELGSYPQVCDHEVTEESRLPQQVFVPSSHSAVFFS